MEYITIRDGLGPIHIIEESKFKQVVKGDSIGSGRCLCGRRLSGRPVSGPRYDLSKINETFGFCSICKAKYQKENQK